MYKDFDGWNEIKKRTHDRVHAPYFREREVWWCTVGINVGFEEDGKGAKFQRPVLILRGLSRYTCIVVPLTSSKQTHRYRVSIGSIRGVETRTILSQLKVIDAHRLTEKISVLERNTFEHVRKSVRMLF